MAPDEAGRKVTHPSGHQAALTAPPSMWGSQGRRGWFPEGGGRMGGDRERKGCCHLASNGGIATIGIAKWEKGDRTGHILEKAT